MAQGKAFKMRSAAGKCHGKLATGEVVPEV